MTYVKVDTTYPKPRRELDVTRFTTDLGKALGGTVVNDEYGRGFIETAEFRITVDSIWNAPDKAALHIRGKTWDWLGGDEPSGDAYRFPSIRVSVDRPMDKLVADVKRRLLEPAHAPLVKRAEHVAMIRARKNDLAATAERLAKRWPTLSVRVEKDATQNGTIYHNGKDTPYLSGRVSADGKVTVDHLGTLTAEQFERFMKALYE